jgi:urease accessory protein
LIRERICAAWVLFATVFLAQSALAHDGQAGGFLTGLSHPVSGLDHIAAMIAVGLWGSQLGKPAVWVLPVMFPMVMAFGAFLALIGIDLPGVEIGIALSAVVLGAMVMMEAKPPMAVSVFIVSVFAIFHGQAHGTELPANQNSLVYSVGFVVATGLLHATGITIGAIHHWNSGPIVVRVLGGVILAGGLYFLWGAVG